MKRTATFSAQWLPIVAADNLSASLISPSTLALGLTQYTPALRAVVSGPTTRQTRDHSATEAL